jgi:xylan 1,4-beta-xylosidase
MPEPLPSADFYAHHSPFGAFASFTLGRYGRKGGFGLELSGPAAQDVYVAVVRPGEPARALPFFADARATEADAYTGGAEAGDAEPAPGGWRDYAPGEIVRALGWASDRWTAGDLTFTLYTPFGKVPDLLTLGDHEIRRHVCPAILAEITLDNTASAAEAYAFFGVGGGDALRPLSDGGNGLTGIARGGEWGFAVVPDGGEAREVLTWPLLGDLARVFPDGPPPVNRLANRGGLLLRVAAGERRTYRLVLGFYRGGVVTSGIATSYLYSRVFPDLEAVLGYAIENAGESVQRAERRDAELDAAPLNAERKFLLAHATHSYFGSTMLLHDERGVTPPPPFAASSVHRPLWVVNEGEYRMLNTFDLTVDHAFFETRYHPWTLKNTLELFVARYSYRDEVQDATDPGRPRFPGGISFTHDMGVANQFTPSGYSSYERPDLAGCFSYMTMEQLCNWCLCAALYGLPTLLSEGDLFWLTTKRATLRACLDSLIHRDGPDRVRNGVMSLDAARCGTGQEITTYDSLDESLGQARANGYLAVKTWASYLALSRCFDALGDDSAAAEAEEQAARVAASVVRHFDADAEIFPAVFEEGNPGHGSRILPAIEGLAYPHLWKDDEAVSPFGPYGELVGNLRRHLKTVLVPGVCVDATSGGFKLSSSSVNTWMSKIFLSQFVAEQVLGFPLAASYDSAHARWQRDGDCRDHAFTDQVSAPDGKDLGSRYYPRGVTAVLWLLG